MATNTDWEHLIDYYNSVDVAGLKFKVKAGNWDEPVTRDTAFFSGFSASPTGRRQIDGSFIYLGTIAHYWTNTIGSDSNYLSSILIPCTGTNVLNAFIWSLRTGLACRCVKD